MQNPHMLETRAYPVPLSIHTAENELEFMAWLSLIVSGGNKCRMIEPSSNPNRFRKSADKLTSKGSE